MKLSSAFVACLLLCVACAPVATKPTAVPAASAGPVRPAPPAPASPVAAVPAAAAVIPAAVIPEPAASPVRVQASYLIYKGDMEVAQIEETFTRTGDRYTLSSTAQPLGLLALFKPGRVYISSQGTIDQHGLKPQTFTYRHEIDSSKASRAEFDWNARQLNLTHQPAGLALPAGTQDRLSAMYQFMFLSLRARDQFDLDMTNGSKLDHYHYAVASGQQISTAAGNFSTLYLDSLNPGKPAKAGENRTELWLAEKFHHLPCKMVITDADGGQLSQILTRLDIKP